MSEASVVDEAKGPSALVDCSKIEDVSLVKAVAEDLVKSLRAMKPSREISVAITHMQTARMWLDEHIRVS